MNIYYGSFLPIESGNSLIDVLPNSLETLKLYTIKYQEGISRQLLQMLEAKEQFPSWTKLSLQSWLATEEGRALHEACQKEGVAWELYLGYNASFWGRSGLNANPQLLHKTYFELDCAWNDMGDFS